MDTDTCLVVSPGRPVGLVKDWLQQRAWRKELVKKVWQAVIQTDRVGCTV
jgi:hypothetical protein